MRTPTEAGAAAGAIRLIAAAEADPSGGPRRPRMVTSRLTMAEVLDAVRLAAAARSAKIG